MNENINLAEILDGCPEGTVFYSPVFGDAEFAGILDDYLFCVTVTDSQGCRSKIQFKCDGTLDDFFDTTECMLFPSATQRDWSKFEKFWDKPKVKRFDPKTFQPFDKVLVRNYNNKEWSVSLFSNWTIINGSEGVIACGNFYNHCIPYNEDTKHLVGTANNCPEYYKWWEE